MTRRNDPSATSPAHADCAPAAVAGIDLTSGLKIRDRIRITGHTTDVELTLESMQVDNADVTEANPGDSVGIKVPDRVRPGDHVYRIT